MLSRLPSASAKHECCRAKFRAPTRRQVRQVYGRVVYCRAVVWRACATFGQVDRFEGTVLAYGPEGNVLSSYTNPLYDKWSLKNQQ